MMQEKIGIGNFLWAFAAEATTKVKNEEAALARAHAEAVVWRTHKLAMLPCVVGSVTYCIPELRATRVHTCAEAARTPEGTD